MSKTSKLLAVLDSISTPDEIIADCQEPVNEIITEVKAMGIDPAMPTKTQALINEK